jgi:hypothetical protein
MSTINSKRGDTARPITDVLTFNGAPINLTGCTVVLVIKPVENQYGNLSLSSPFRRNASILSPATSGAVTYQPILADVNLVGEFLMEWEVTFPDTKIVTVPDNGFHIWNITPDLP